MSDKNTTKTDKVIDGLGEVTGKLTEAGVKTGLKLTETGLKAGASIGKNVFSGARKGLKRTKK